MADADWTCDEKTGLWYKGRDRTTPYANDYSKIPFTADEILRCAKEMAVRVGTAALTTLSSEGGFPHSRLVSPGKYISEDFSSVSVATRMHTRKVSEIREVSEKVSLFWQDGRGWLAVQGTARVEPGAGEGEEQKGKVQVEVHRLEMQDYTLHVTGNGFDEWRPAVLERRGEGWMKLQ